MKLTLIVLCLIMFFLLLAKFSVWITIRKVRYCIMEMSLEDRFGIQQMMRKG